MTRLLSSPAKLVAMAAVVVLACAENRTPMELPTEGAGLAPSYGKVAKAGKKLKVVKHKAAKSHAAAASAWVDENGGSLSVGGWTLTIPAGALDGRTRITLVAPKGVNVELQALPSGLTFNVPATLSVDLSGTDGGSGVQGVYFTGLISNGLVDPAEIFSTTVENGVASFQITHFSAYCIVSNGCICD